jgi:hypothetical protein
LVPSPDQSGDHPHQVVRCRHQSQLAQSWRSSDRASNRSQEEFRVDSEEYTLTGDTDSGLQN